VVKIAQLVECNLAKVKVVGSIPVFHFTNLKFITMFYFALTLLELLVVIVPLLISVAYFTLAERKIMGAMQRRKGPNVIGVFGLLQPLADGLKLFAKETILPSTANTSIF
jgi:NADH:ubiquinone oxidoreductase subunit H